MRVFLTGATGFVGSAVTAELLGAGHEVLGLVRTDAAAARLAGTGAAVLRGSITEPDVLRRGAADADAVIHTAFNHDFSRFAASCEEDRLAIETMGEALMGSERPLLVTSGISLLAPGRVATETDVQPTGPGHHPRRSEAAAAALGERGVRARVIRLAPSVHGPGDRGFVPMAIAVAREKNVSAFIGDGSNRWPGVHRQDAARLYRLALEHGDAGGPFHAVADKGVPFRDIAAAIGRHLGIPVVSLSPEAAATHFGWFTTFVGADVPASSERTRAALGWTTEQPGLLADIDQAGYFAA